MQADDRSVMYKGPQRTCIGCRRTLNKSDVVRIVAGPSGLVIDYREKLPGRGVYVCPDPKCIKTALFREGLSRGLKTNIKAPAFDEFIRMLIGAVKDKMISLIAMSAKAGMLKAGYSAVKDSIEKARASLVITASDASDETVERLMPSGDMAICHRAPFKKDEIGGILGRGEVAVLSIEHKGFAASISKELVRLKTLLNKHE